MIFVLYIIDEFFLLSYLTLLVSLEVSEYGPVLFSYYRIIDLS